MNNKSLNILILIILISSCNTKQFVKNSVFIVDNTKYEFIKVEQGIFDMGCEPSTLDNLIVGKKYDCMCTSSNIKENVKVDSFYISKYFITRKQFKQFIDETNYITSLDSLGKISVAIKDTISKVPFPKDVNYQIDRKLPYTGYSASIIDINWQYSSYLKKYGDNELDHPVSFVSIYDAKAFCKWLSRRLNKNIRLLVEKEWEFAARGGNNSEGHCRPGTNKPFKNIIDTSYAYVIHPSVPVTSYIPNELDIYCLNKSEMVDTYYNQMLVIRGGIVWSRRVTPVKYGEISSTVHFRVVIDLT